MTIQDELKSAVLQLSKETLEAKKFEALALEIFRFQAVANPIYAQYLHHLQINPLKINLLTQIPFLPIQFFKYHKIISGNAHTPYIFESSGTTGQINSKHYVSDLPFYEHISRQIFENFYGSLQNFHVLALLPSYLERNNSSLVYMVQNFIFHSHSEHSGFYLNNTNELLEKIKFLGNNEQDKRKILLIGVTFALLDLAESSHDLSFLMNFSENIIVMETGGMKGRRKELLREEVHEILTHKLYVSKIHSEYGMTELLSQGYSKGKGIFHLPASMKVFLREINDPFQVNFCEEKIGFRGGINVIDLANIDSCSFIETQDVGNISENGFSIIGRFDNSDIRGCNLMAI